MPGRELVPWEVLADLFGEEGFELADANGAAKAAVQRLEDAGFKIVDPHDAATLVLGIANRSAGDPMWADFAAAILQVPPHLIPTATQALTQIVERGRP
jgi:hypothetical protein